MYSTEDNFYLGSQTLSILTFTISQPSLILTHTEEVETVPQLQKQTTKKASI